MSAKCPIIAGLSVAVAFASGHAMGQEADDVSGFYVDGQKLTEWCREFLVVRRQGGEATAQQAVGFGNCYGFVVGILDAVEFEGSNVSRLVAREGLSICPPDQLNGNDAAEIVALYADQHPEVRTQPGYVLTRRAMAEAFPC